MGARWYTVELCFWNPELCTVSVKASSVEEACEKALEQSDDEYGNGGGRTCYDACTDTKVSLIKKGRGVELYANNTGPELAIPDDFRDVVMCDKPVSGASVAATLRALLDAPCLPPEPEGEAIAQFHAARGNARALLAKLETAT